MTRRGPWRWMGVLTLCLSASVLVAATRQTPSAAEMDRSATAEAEHFVDRLVAGDIDGVEATFDATVKAALPADRLRATWVQIVAEVGPFKRRVSSRVVNAGTSRVVIVTCEFDHATLDLNIGISAAAEVSAFLIRPGAPPPPAAAADLPSYADPQRYSEVDVTVGTGQWKLPGTLTLPVGAGPWPAIVLVHESGPNDRDESVGMLKPFRDLALGLATRGIAVLRYEKRTREYGATLASSGLSGFTVKEETTDDAVAAVARLRADSRIDRRRIVVLGHSLGAMLMPRIAAAVGDAAGFILMAAPARPMEDLILNQAEYLANLDGTISPEEQQQIDEVKRMVVTVHNLRPEDASGSIVIAGLPASYWLDLGGYDPAAAARAIAKPMLVLQGERDFQVFMEDFARWKTAMAGRRNVTLTSYPALNHLFVAGTGPGNPDEYSRPGHVDAAVIQDISAWMGRLPPS